MSLLQRRINAWQKKAFPDSTPMSKWHHLKDEIEELKDGNFVPDEAADCMMLLFGIAGIYKYDILRAVRRKLKINKRRKWGKPDHRGVVKHVDDEIQIPGIGDLEKIGVKLSQYLYEVDINHDAKRVIGRRGYIDKHESGSSEELREAFEKNINSQFEGDTGLTIRYSYADPRYMVVLIDLDLPKDEA